MRNRAKCKLCNSILESKAYRDYVICKCGEISIDGGPDELRCYANDWNNFLRIDDEGNEIIVKVEDNVPKTNPDVINKLSKEDLIKELDRLIESIEKLPIHVQQMPVSNADLSALLVVLSSILKF